MKKTLVAIVTVVLLLMVLTNLAFASPPAAQIATPFKGTFQGQETHTVLPEGRFLVSGNGGGVSTQLGLYTLHYEIEVTIATGLGTNGMQRFVAANGDVIYAEGHGQGVPTAIPGVNKITESYTITGGTGRFAGASGSLIMVRMVELATGATWGGFNGTIMIPSGN